MLNDLKQRIRNLKTQTESLDYKKVRIAVDQEVGSVRAAGVTGNAMSGVLLRFSEDHPGLTIEITDIRTGHYDVFERGTRTEHHPVLGNTNAP